MNRLAAALGTRRLVVWIWLGWAAVAAVALWSHTGTHVAARRVAIRVQPSAFAESLALDTWSEETGPGLPLDMVVGEDALGTLAAARITWQVLVPDVDAVADAEAMRLHEARPGGFFDDYRDYAAISNRLAELAELAPSRAKLQSIGGSIEGRPIWALRIGPPDGTPMLIDGTQHAREWIAAMVTTCVADRLVRNYDSDPAIRDFVDHTALWVVPVANPDGYQYSWAGHRYWRKNRRDQRGVDLNRNFAVGWGGDGSSGNQRAETYRGAYAFSEPESAALRDLAKRERVALHVDFHAYGQLLLYPWGYTAAPAQDRDRLAAVGDRIASALFAPHETRYRLMPAVQLYRASGIMTDWMYGEAKAMSYTIELRPKSGSGFVLPPEQIRPTCDEGLAAVLTLRASQK